MSPASRRALLAGAVGGIGAWVATVLGGRNPVRADDPNDVVKGVINSVTTTTSLLNTTTSSIAFSARNTSTGMGMWAYSASNNGLFGETISGRGVYGYADSGIGVYGTSNFNHGTYGISEASDKSASLGWNTSDSTGVMGFSDQGPGPLPAAKPKTGVFGYANQDSAARGVWGHSPIGIGVYGQTSTGYAGYFRGKVFSTSFYELGEIATPGAPGANKARLFIRDNGSGKSQLCVRFATGSVKLLATE